MHAADIKLPRSDCRDAGGSLRHDAIHHLIKAAAEELQGASADHLDISGRLLCVHARHDGLTPEQLIIEVKAALQSGSWLPLLSPETREAMRARIVSLLIKAYFSDGVD